jgi:hypothetical protein
MPDGHWSLILPESLFNRAEPLTNTSVDILDEVNRLEFSGRGSTIEFSLQHHNLKQFVKKMGEPSFNDDVEQGTWGWQNMNGQFDFSSGFDSDHTFGLVAIDFEIASFLHYENDKSNKKTTSKEKETSISFLLGDGGDVFVVDVFNDPTYGTFLFKTVSSCSLCCHKANMARTVYLSMPVWSRPKAHVLRDNQMVFKLKLGNVGAVPYRCLTYWLLLILESFRLAA